MNDTEPLHMLQLGLRTDGVLELARRRRLRLRDVDLGYGVHCALRELFGESSPQPFSIGPEPSRYLTVLGYCRQPYDALRQHADDFADPWLHGLVDWSSGASKAMPASFTGRRLCFETRVTPVVRASRGAGVEREGTEVDAFLHACARAGDGVDVSREDVYRDWFLARANGQGALVRSVRVDGFTLAKFTRRDHGEERKSRSLVRPDVTVSGELTVEDDVAFRRWLARGVGRHRAFGFGMLLLRPPTASAC